VTSCADAVFELLPSSRPLKHGARVRIHQGTTEVLGRLALAGRRGAAADAGEVPSMLLPGEHAYVRARLEGPAVLTRGDRFVVRAYPRSAIRTPAGRRRFERLDSSLAPPDEAIAAMVEERGAGGLPVAALVSRAGIPPGEVEATIGRLIDAERGVQAGDVLVSPRVLAHLRDRLMAELRAHHVAQPLSEGVPREELRERLFGRASLSVFSRVLADLTSDGRLVARDRVALAGHRVALSPQEDQARAAIEAVLRRAGLTPPDSGALRETAGVAPDVADRVIALLVRQRVLVRLDTLVFHADALERLKADIAQVKAAPAPPSRLDVAAFKERYGITRKYAIPLLEYLDRERVTRRVGDSRMIL
jgi:selenocysteine-specific elongation factor